MYLRLRDRGLGRRVAGSANPTGQSGLYLISGYFLSEEGDLFAMTVPWLAGFWQTIRGGHESEFLTVAKSYPSKDWSGFLADCLRVMENNNPGLRLGKKKAEKEIALHAGEHFGSTEIGQAQGEAGADADLYDQIKL